MTKTCMNCSLYIGCTDKRKSFTYYCDKFRHITQEDLFYTAKSGRKDREAKMAAPVRATSDPDVDTEFNIQQIVEHALTSSSSTPIDVKINDSHIPKAVNFYEFATGQDFLNIKPYVEQMCIATVLFSEYCPECSDMDWLMDDHKVTDSLRKFAKRVALLENGVCPHCRATKAKLVIAKKLIHYQELAVSAGQRCVTGDTVVLTPEGRATVAELIGDAPYGFSDPAQDIFLFNGRAFERASRVFRAAPEPIFEVRVADAVLKGTGDHPVATQHGWVRLKDLRVGDKVWQHDVSMTGDTAHSTNVRLLPVTDIAIVADEETYDFTLPETHQFWSNGFISHNSGKSALVAMMSAYLTHRILKLQKPNEVYGLLHSNVLQGTFVALTYAQAKDTLWEPYYGYLTSSPWFSQYHAFLDEQSQRYGEELYKLNDTFVVYRHRSATVYPSGPDKRTLRGRCLDGDTLVNTNFGTVKLSEFIEYYGYREVVGLTIDTPFGRRPVSHVYKAESTTLTVTTENGFEVTGTPEHPLLILREQGHEWCRLDSLQPGDVLVARTRLNKPAYGASDVSPENAALLGHSLAHASTDVDIPVVVRRGTEQALHSFMEALFSWSLVWDSAEPAFVMRLSKRVAKQVHVILLHHYGIKGRLSRCDLSSRWHVAFTGDAATRLLQSFGVPALREYAPLFPVSVDAHEDHYETVASVVPGGTRTVYDVTVPNGHAFTANGLASHNTRFLSSIDELGWFDSEADSKKIKMNANEIYIALERSLLTVRAASTRLIQKGFSDVPTGYFLNISSPSSVRDKIMELVRKSENSRKIYGLIKPTWEMNPTVTYDDLKEEFDKDAVTAWRDYGAQPPLSSNAFIQSNDAVERCCTGKKNGVQYTLNVKNYGDESYRHAKITNIKRISRKSVLALDAGLTNNSFSCVCGYPEDGRFVAHTLVEVMPLPGIPINFTLVYKNIISKLIEYQNVVYVVADRWNSAKILSDAREDYGVATEQYSMKYRDFWYVRDFMFDGSLLMPTPSVPIKDCITYDLDGYPTCYELRPVDHLVLQTLTVRDTGTTITKGDGGLTDDLFRALALAVQRCSDEKVQELFIEDGEAPPRPTVFAVVKSIPQSTSIGNKNIVDSQGRAVAIGKRSKAG